MNKLSKKVLNVVEKVAKISAGASSWVYSYEPKTPAALVDKKKSH